MTSYLEEQIESLLEDPQYSSFHEELQNILTNLECDDIDYETAKDLFNNLMGHSQ